MFNRNDIMPTSPTNKINASLNKSICLYTEWTTRVTQKNLQWEKFAREEKENMERAVRVKNEPIAVDEERKQQAIKRTKKLVRFKLEAITPKGAQTPPFRPINFDNFLESVKSKYENENSRKKNSSIAELERHKNELAEMKRMNQKLDEQIRLARAAIQRGIEAVDAELAFLDEVSAQFGLEMAME